MTEQYPIKTTPHLAYLPYETILAQPLSRREFLQVMAGATVGFSVGAIIPDFFDVANSEAEISFSATAELAINDTGKDIIEVAFREYVQRYGYANPEIAIDLADFSSQTEIDSEGYKIIVTEEAGPGIIKLDLNVISNSSDPERELRNIILHAMTHATKPAEYTILDKQLSLGDSKIEGYSGLIVFMKSDEERFSFKLFEEAAAEALAVFINPEYVVASDTYHQLGTLTIRLTNTFSSPEALARMVQTNDVMGFVGMVVGKADPTIIDFSQVKRWYEIAAKGIDLKSIETEILEYRRN